MKLGTIVYLFKKFQNSSKKLMWRRRDVIFRGWRQKNPTFLKWRYFCFYSTWRVGWPLVELKICKSFQIWKIKVVLGLYFLMTSSHFWRHFQNDVTWPDSVGLSWNSTKFFLVISSNLCQSLKSSQYSNQKLWLTAFIAYFPNILRNFRKI